MADTVSTRLDRDLMRDLGALQKESGRKRSELLREALRQGLRAIRVEEAVHRYAQREISLGRARELARMPLPDFLDALRKAGVALDYASEDLAEDLAWASS